MIATSIPIQLEGTAVYKIHFSPEKTAPMKVA
jgi:hypothetical protein